MDAMGNVKADSTYGTKRASAYRIIEDTLNLRDPRIFDYVYDEHGNKKAVFNAKETTAAQAKQEVIKQAFQDWIWKDPERRNRLVRYYNDTFNSVRPREYDGSHITFGGISALGSVRMIFVISSFAVKDFPAPDTPRIKELPLRSCLRLAIIIFLLITF